MVAVATSDIIAAPIDAVWEVIRDFNGHESWHPAVSDSAIEGRHPSDKVGCVRAFHLAGGEFLRERLLSLSDAETMFRYCLLDTPIPLFNYVAQVRLIPVTVSDTCFIHWSARFQTPKGEETALSGLVRDGVQRAGIEAIKEEVRGHAH
ncbi:MAG: SRPBCC family protein [Paracoccaceae bacterium]|nr:SRPBCC family protein [Paracoccaceae bacterium]